MEYSAPEISSGSLLFLKPMIQSGNLTLKLSGEYTFLEALQTEQSLWEKFEIPAIVLHCEISRESPSFLHPIKD